MMNYKTNPYIEFDSWVADNGTNTQVMAGNYCEVTQGREKQLKHTFSFSRYIYNNILNWYRKITILLTFSIFALTNAVTAVAQHSTITPDGVLSDWCFQSMLPITGPDSMTVLTCPGPMPVPTGTEVVWEDFVLDLIFGPTDITYFASAGSANSVYFAVGMTAPIFPAKHVQIAIDVAPAVGNSVWYNPDGALLPAVGTSVGIEPDYLITTSGLLGMAVLWEATTTPGSWTMVGAPFLIGVNNLDLEIAIPWASFGPGVCAGCPVFDPMTMPQLTFIAAEDSGAFGGTAGAPSPGFAFPYDVSDVISEPVPGTYTTAPVACPSPGTICENTDGSVDAFLTSPTLPVELKSFSIE